jgi:hypothetical protein
MTGGPVARRRQYAVAAVLVIAAGAALAVGLAKGGKTATAPTAATTVERSNAKTAPPPPAAVEAGLLPWHLASAVSREVVAVRPGTPGLVLLGGLEANDSSANGVDVLDTRNGAVTAVNPLPRATHDAAGAALPGGRILVLGGGTTSVSAATQIATRGGASAGVGLPQARADASAVAVGGDVYVIGGYDGSAMDREVLATNNGRTYRAVAALPVPVRYAAVAALGSRIYVFGGLGANGRPVDTVQLVDTATRTAHIVGHLPRPLDGAAAGTLAGTIYVAGGSTGRAPTKAIYAFDPRARRFLYAGALRVAVANAGSAVRRGRLWIVGGEGKNGQPTSNVQMVVPNRRFGIAGKPGAGSPFFGDQLLIADRGNDRLLLLDDTDRITWHYPSAGRPAPRGGFYFPDDAFFIRKGTAIISNQEDNDTLVELAYPSGRIIWRYGHARQSGTAPGYLNTPDDTYLLGNGEISVADAVNCRVLVISPRTKRVLHQIGTPGRCYHQPPAALGSPNGDTPLANGDLLVSEINGSWIDELTLGGRLVWSTKLAIAYPSDPQQLGPNHYLVADYSDPGGIVEFNRRGRIDYRYQVASGPGALNHPSLVERLPSGVFMLNDDYNHRVLAIDPATKALVWQYGVTGRSGTAPGFLNTPDGFDVLAPDGSTPTHPTTG